MSAGEQWKSQLEVLGSFIRTQRQLAKLSLREMAELTLVSNPYLSQVERGLHEPSLRVLKAIARALNLSAETILSQAGLLEDGEEGPEEGGASLVEGAIGMDPVLSQEQKEALLGVYRSYVAVQRSPGEVDPAVRRSRRGPNAAKGAPLATTDGASPLTSRAPRTRPSRKGVVAVPGSARTAPTSPDQVQPVAPSRKLASPGD